MLLVSEITQWNFQAKEISKQQKSDRSIPSEVTFYVTKEGENVNFS
jgi:hypothetical protein